MKSPRRLRGTRHLVKSRLAIVVALTILILSFVSLSYQTEARGATTSSTTVSTVRTSITSASSTISTTSTNSTAPRSADLYRVDPASLDQLVNSTSLRFANSTGSVPYYVVSQGRNVTGLVFLTTDVSSYYSYGFRGPIGILVYLSPAGIIKSLMLWTSVEPMTYDITPQYLSTYTNRSVFEQLAVGADVVGITGATFSSVAIAGGVRVGGRLVVNDYSQAQLLAQTVSKTQTQTMTETQTTTYVQTSTTTSANESQAALSFPAVAGSWQFTSAGLIVAFFSTAVLAYETNSDKLRYTILASAVVLLGFYQVLMVSITDATIFLAGALPPLLTHYYWYVLYLGVLLTSVAWGRLYCGSICPFGAFIHLLYKVSPYRFVMPKRFHSKLIYLKYVILVLVVLGIGWSALWVAKIEPFETLFLLRGDSWMWGVLGGAVLFSIPFDRFYCAYICPAGAGMSLAARMRVMEINRWPECATCKVCERDCPTGAISDGKISAFECFNCRACELNYSNTALCPHYASQRVPSIVDVR